MAKPDQPRQGDMTQGNISLNRQRCRGGGSGRGGWGQDKAQYGANVEVHGTGRSQRPWQTARGQRPGGFRPEWPAECGTGKAEGDPRPAVSMRHRGAPKAAEGETETKWNRPRHLLSARCDQSVACLWRESSGGMAATGRPGFGMPQVVTITIQILSFTRERVLGDGLAVTSRSSGKSAQIPRLNQMTSTSSPGVFADYAVQLCWTSYRCRRSSKVTGSINSAAKVCPLISNPPILQQDGTRDRQ